MIASNRDFAFFLALAASLHAVLLYSSRLQLPPAPPRVLHLRLAPTAPIDAARERPVPLPATPQFPAAPSIVEEPTLQTTPASPDGAALPQQRARSSPAPSSVALPALPRAEPVAEPASKPEPKHVEVPARASYEQLLAAWLDKHKYYPSTLRRRGIEGEGVLRVRLGRDGRVAAIESADGFGNTMLEAVARDWIARADPFPAVPDAVSGSYYLVRFPVRFRLQ